MTNDFKLFKGDCLEIMKDIKDKSIDMILCDLPYGTTDCKWDVIIPFELLWEQYNRITKDDGVIALFGSEPFSTLLRTSNFKKYKYEWYWIKNNPTGYSFCKYQPMRDIENIIIFKNKLTNKYNPQNLIKLEKPKTKMRKSGQQGLIYKEDGLVNKVYKTEFTNYPRNTLYFKPERKGMHPTQKPVALLEYLIKTYTNEGETVLDNCMGSGSTGEACLRTNRNFIGIEKDDKYFDIAYNRINGYIYMSKGEEDGSIL